MTLEEKYRNIDGTPKSLQEIICENIKISEKLRCDINKESNIFNILDMSLFCISLLTNDKPFYTHNRKKIVKFMDNTI